MAVTICIDWLAMTFKGVNPHEEEYLDRFARTPTVVDATAHNGYTSATTDENGVQISWNNDRPEMGRHAVFGGSSLRNIFERSGVSSQTLLLEALHAGASITRLDLAKDAQNVRVDLDAVWDALRSDSRKGSARKVERHQGADGGYTIYLGSRQSERFIRIYDKAKESKLDGELWFRLEVEAKGMVARAIADALRKTSDWSGTFDTIVNAMVGDVEEACLAEFFPDGPVLMGLPKIQRTSDREKWIKEQVVQAVSKHYIDFPNSEAVRLLRDILDLIDRQRKE